MALSHSPTPAASRTVLPVGSQAECGTRTSIWRRLPSTLTENEPRSAFAASVSFAVVPCTVRNLSAGAFVFAPSGICSSTPGVPPIAIVIPYERASFIVLSVIRNAVESASGLTRNSTRSAAFIA